MAEIKRQFTGLSSDKGTGARLGPSSPLLAPYSEQIRLTDVRIEARIDLLEGRLPAAIAKVTGTALPMDTVTADLIKALQIAQGKPATPIAQLGSQVAERKAKARAAFFDSMVELATLEPETERTNSVYKRSRPNVLGAVVGAALTMGVTLLEGVKNTDGFSAQTNSNGTVRVSLTGATMAPAVVREMALLRSAEIAVAQAKPKFVIVDRHDYTRTQTTTRNGTMVASLPTGYKTDLTIRLLDGSAPSDRAIVAQDVIQALGPFYYKDAG